MSNFYEFALLMTVKPDAEEATATLQHMVEGQGFDFTSSLSNPMFSEPARTVVQPSGVMMRVVPVWHGFFSGGYTEFEEEMPGSFGSSFSENRLAVRRVTHEDEFFNIWDELSNWLASISATSGLVGYYCNIEEDPSEAARIIYFENGQVSEASVEDVQVIDGFVRSLETTLSSPDL